MNSPNLDYSAATLTKKDYEALASFRYALRRFLHFSEEAAAGANLSSQQHQALLAIRGFPERDAVTVGELAERLQIRPNSAVGLVDRLVSRGLVERESNEGDRRKVLVRLTPQGEATLEELSTVHRDELRRTGPKLLALLESVAGKLENRRTV